MEILRNVAVEGDRAVIIVTHDARVLEFGDRIARMEDGHIIGVEEGARDLAAAS
jgi:putative ABC transport system ATP-binding protein